MRIARCRFGQAPESRAVGLRRSIEERPDRRPTNAFPPEVLVGPADKILVFQVYGVAVNDGIDTNSEGSQFHLGMLALVAEWERDRRRASFAASITSAIERGVHVGPTPVGYVRNGDRRLRPDPEVAPAVVRVFQGRAEGTSWRNLARAFNTEMERLGRDERISHSDLHGVVGSKTYRGSCSTSRTSCTTRTRRSSPRTTGTRHRTRARHRHITGRSRGTAN